MRILLTGADGFIVQHLACAVRRARTSPDPRLSCIHADDIHDTEQSVWLARLSGAGAQGNPAVRAGRRQRRLTRHYQQLFLKESP